MEKVIRVRITEELKERFAAVCDKNAINQSALIRKWIEEYTKENEEEN